MSSRLARPLPHAGGHYANVPLLAHKHRGQTLIGWSRAGIQTGWAHPEIGLMVDCGAPFWDLASMPRLAITHAHPDHMSGLPSYVATRAMIRASTTTVYVPVPIEDDVRALLATWERMTGDPFRPDIVPCQPGDRLPIGTNLELRPFVTTHVIPSQGYAVTELRMKLRPELVGLPGEELGRRRRQGEEVSVPSEVHLLAVTGDTTVDALDANPWLYDAQTLVIESTFVAREPDPSHARRFGHVHLGDLAARADCFRNERLVLGHFSMREPPEAILAAIEQALPEELLARTVAWI